MNANGFREKIVKSDAVHKRMEECSVKYSMGGQRKGRCVEFSSDTMNELNGFRESAPPKNRQPIVQ